MKAMIPSAVGLALAVAACGGTVVVDADDEGSGGAPYAEQTSDPPSSCLPCLGAACGYCPESDGRVTYVCFEGMPPPTAGDCYEAGSLFSTEAGEFYTCSLCSP